MAFASFGGGPGCWLLGDGGCGRWVEWVGVRCVLCCEAIMVPRGFVETASVGSDIFGCGFWTPDQRIVLRASWGEARDWEN